MKKVTSVLLAIIGLFIYAVQLELQAAPAQAQSVAWVWGGFKKAEAVSPNSVRFDCGNDMSLKCYGVTSNRELIIGQPVKLFVNNNNILTPLNEPPDVGTGYINVILEGIDMQGLEPFITIKTTPETIIVSTYKEWIEYIDE